ncbi:MAG: penicillin-binding protein 1C [Candidatus Aminicenantes bacterium]|nr:penicillin-binding protein 1C [Candidatus Aminicenantes bacterium]
MIDSETIKRVFTYRRDKADILFLAILVIFVFLTIHKPPLTENISFSQTVYDRNGKLLRSTLSSDDKYRVWTPLSEISPYLIRATILKEDRCFKWHPGFNPMGLIRAFWQTYVTKSRRTGGSTITMQLARLRFGINTRTIPGKLKQILKAVQMEFHYSKKIILEAYLNLVPYGWNVEGAGAASLIYFHKNPHQLNLLESLSLAVIPQDPSAILPLTRKDEDKTAQNNLNQTGHSHPNIFINTRFTEARNRLFHTWTKHYPQDGKLSPYLDLPLETFTPSELPFSAPHFVEDILKTSSLEKIKTTLDIGYQHLLERHTQNYVTRCSHLGITNAAALLANASTMEVLACLGSADYFNDSIQGQVNGTTAKRSPGSLLKPFIYGKAIEKGLIHPKTMLKDTPLSFGAFNPENFEQDFAGPIKAQEALVRSRNVPAVWLASQIGSESLYEFLKQAEVSHLKKPAFYGMAGLVLGGIELTMEELAALYAMLARGGKLYPLRKQLCDPPAKGIPLLSQEASFLTLEMLKENPPPKPEFFSHWVKNSIPVAWKTGTSYAFRDAWAIGIFGDFVLAVWVGHFDGSGNPAFVGRRAAGPLLFELIDSLKTKGIPESLYYDNKTLNLTEVEVCALSGHLPGPYCPRTIRTWFIPGTSPITTCDIHRPVFIHPETGLRVPPHYRGESFKKIYEFWPSDLLDLFKRAGIPRKTPPPFDPRYDPGFRSQPGIPPKITSPRKTLTYTIRAGQASSDSIAFQAVADADAENLYWFVNESFLGKCPVSQPLFWNPEPGRFVIRVIDDRGRSDSTSLVVSVVR